MDFLGSLQATTIAVSKIDAISSMAEVSQSNNYVRPECQTMEHYQFQMEDIQ